jgi:GDPmannose 4,6-dehydratase
LGNSAKARAQLGWQHKVSFRELLREMVEADLKLISERSDGLLRIDRP